MQNKLLQVTSMNMIIVEKDGLEIKVDYDVLVLCTGFSYDQPVKGEGALTLADRKKNHVDFYNKVSSANSILIGGAGIVGVELAGEFAVKYAASKEKKIGICLRGNQLLPGLPQKAGRLAEEFLKRNNVEIHKQTPFGPTSAKELGYDFSIQCTGYRYNTSFMKDNFAKCLAPNGQIYVNDLFQISSVDPRIDPIAKGVKENIFAFGDVCQTSLNEQKSAISIAFLASILGKSLA